MDGGGRTHRSSRSWRSSSPDGDRLSIVDGPTMEPMVGDPDDHRPHTRWALVTDPGDASGRVETLAIIREAIAVGDRIPLHTHDVDEAITILAGEGDARLGDERAARRSPARSSSFRRERRTGPPTRVTCRSRSTRSSRRRRSRSRCSSATRRRAPRPTAASQPLRPAHRRGDAARSDPSHGGDNRPMKLMPPGVVVTADAAPRRGPDAGGARLRRAAASVLQPRAPEAAPGPGATAGAPGRRRDAGLPAEPDREPRRATGASRPPRRTSTIAGSRSPVRPSRR